MDTLNSLKTDMTGGGVSRKSAEVYVRHELISIARTYLSLHFLPPVE